PAQPGTAHVLHLRAGRRRSVPANLRPLVVAPLVRYLMVISLRIMSRVSVLCVAFAFTVFAQTPDTASIHGQVTDQSRAAVAGVRISARNSQTGLERTAQTDAAGNFSL